MIHYHKVPHLVTSNEVRVRNVALDNNRILLLDNLPALLVFLGLVRNLQISKFKLREFQCFENIVIYIFRVIQHHGPDTTEAVGHLHDVKFCKVLFFHPRNISISFKLDNEFELQYLQ